MTPNVAPSPVPVVTQLPWRVRSPAPFRYASKYIAGGERVHAVQETTPRTEARFRESQEKTCRMLPQNRSLETRAAKSCRRPTRGCAAQRNDEVDARKSSELMIADAGERVSDLLVLRPAGAQKVRDGTSKLDRKRGVFPPRSLGHRITPEARREEVEPCTLRSISPETINRLAVQVPCRSPGGEVWELEGSSSRFFPPQLRKNGAHFLGARQQRIRVGGHSVWEALTGRVWWRTFLR